MDLLSLVRRLPFAPPFFSEETISKFGQSIEIPQAAFPTPSFALRRTGPDGAALPLAIAHRGHKVDFPENSLRAFEAAIDAGAHAVETDIHLSKDKVVVLSHDADLKRCFGVEKRISDCSWEYLEALQTTREPSQPMACLEDLLKLLAKDSARHVWLMLDIKWDDDHEELMSYTAQIFHKIAQRSDFPWEDRVLLGYWTAPFIPLCQKYFPGFSIVNIGFSVPYSRQFLQIPEIGFNLLQATAALPAGRNFIREAKRHGRQVYAWTVNDEKNMDLCIRLGVDGVITDDVAKFLRVCDSFKVDNKPSWPLKLLFGFAYFNFWVIIFNAVYRSRYGTSLLRNSSTSKSR